MKTEITNVQRLIDALLAAPNGLTAQAIGARTGLRPDQCNNALARLARRGEGVYRDGEPGTRFGTWHHTANRPAQPTRASRIDRMAGTYTCPELSTPPVRPGALDAYRLPSLGGTDGRVAR